MSALTASVDRLQHAGAAAGIANDNADATLTSLISQQLAAQQQLDELRAAALARWSDSAAHVRSLYESGDGLSFLSLLFGDGAPQDLLDRARVAAAMAVGDRAVDAAAAGDTAEAESIARSIADRADAQLSIAATAARRAAGLSAALTGTTALLARADLEMRDVRSREQRAARAAAVRKLAAARAVEARALATARSAAAVAAPALGAGRVPTAYRAAIVQAGASCPPTLSPALLAAQLQVESGWSPTAVSRSGAIGLAQFLPGTWATWGVDADADGIRNPLDPLDAIAGAARYDCAVARAVAGVPGDLADSMLAGYNAGPGAVLAAGGVPSDPGVRDYVRRIRQLAPGFVAGGLPGP